MLNDETLVTCAQEARRNAYCPYSSYAVGAALLCADGSVYTGCNVEGASYGNAICAERVALVKAISEGKRQFIALAVCAGGKDFCTPCGICRQMLYEFSPRLRVLCANHEGAYETHILKDLLPCGFSAALMDHE